MRWVFAGLSAIVLAGAILATKAMLLSYLRAEFAKHGLPYPPKGFNIEVSPALENAIILNDWIQMLLVPLVLVLVILPFAVATVWPKSAASVDASQHVPSAEQ